MNWWEDLTPEQERRLGELIDSRVRLLGETYATAERRAKYDIGEQNKKWVLG